MPRRLSTFLSPRHRRGHASSFASVASDTGSNIVQRKTDSVQQASELTVYSRGAHWNRDWINFTLLRSLLKECDCSASHAVCRAARQKAREPPRWLVDVENECLVPGKPETLYIALSYVWGRIKCYNTTHDSLDDLQQPGALARTEDGRYLPRTIRDAMEICKKLKIRYLWVDMLCIVQDDPQSKHSEIQNMGNIYEGAYVTVIAASGINAESGIWGIPAEEGARKRTRDPEHQAPQYREGSHADAIRSALWYKRGWVSNLEAKTFQEFALSIRTIKFLKDHFLWSCPQLFWSESTDADFREQGFIVKPPDLRWKRMIRPDWHLFYEAASDYNHRYFTYPNDIVDAFRGVEAYLAPLFGQFVYGIPLAYFDVALLWMPRNQNAERRDNAERVPSWSWMSFRSVISCFTNHDSQHIPQDLGGTEWFLKYGDELFSVRKLASSRHFPRPSLESSMPNYPDLRDPTPLLFGKVERVKASIVDIGWHERMVLDRGEKACGMVAVPEVSAWLDGRFELIKMSSHTGSHYISVNTNFRQGDLAEKVAIEDFEAKKDGECVNVMLIEREGDVAFRKGIGYILQESWQTLDREWVGITLR